MPDLTSLTAYRNALQQRQVSSTEIVQQALDRIRETNNQWHMFATTLDESALQSAMLSDHRRLNNKTLGPLDGVPIAIKDNLHIAGCSTYAGTKHNFSTDLQGDAAVVTMLKNTGAVIVGKCCLDELAIGATTNNPHTGQCYNPVHPGCTPGGSSGGSAAAVAAGIVAVAIGSDTMGSVRIPAAYCDLWGLKPTHGLVDSTGMVPLSRTLDAIGPLASNIDDIAAMLHAITQSAVSKPGDAQPSNDWIDTTATLKTYRFAIPDYHGLIECEDSVEADFSNLKDRLANAGCRIEIVKINHWDPPADRREGLLACEAEAATTIKPLIEHFPDHFSTTLKKLINYGHNTSADRLEKSYQTIKNLQTQVQSILQNHDAILMPTTPQRAFPVDSEVPVNQADFCVLANYAACPSLAFPVTPPNSQQPLSVQLTGLALSERRLLNAARLITAPQ